MAEKTGGAWAWAWAWQEHGHGPRERHPTKSAHNGDVLAQGSGKRAEVTGGAPPSFPLGPFFSKPTATGPLAEEVQKKRPRQRQKQHQRDADSVPSLPSAPMSTIRQSEPSHHQHGVWDRFGNDSSPGKVCPLLRLRSDDDRAGQGRAHDTPMLNRARCVSRMKDAMQPDAIRCQSVRSCGSTGRKGRQGMGLWRSGNGGAWLGGGGGDDLL